ncbi:hypothetical protein ALQ53_200013 [Pseudomonas cannabina]|uniref:Uncharacterized protein n=1 Tax=Pseudomonas cannabina TaxID=86840 RepID=A0AB37QDG2_PSECA|nr:hypothetical protein ALQ53_200013 [Pseudomonas cannabina]
MIVAGRNRTSRRRIMPSSRLKQPLAHPNTRFGWPCRLMIVIRLDCLPDDSVTVVRLLPGTKKKSFGLPDLDVTLIASPTGCLIQVAVPVVVTPNQSF